MATQTNRKKKLDKAETVSEPKAAVQQYFCCRCGKGYLARQGNFSKSHSPMYRGTGYLPWCNDCIDDIFNSYCITLGDDRSAMRRMCMKLDIYWSDHIFDMMCKTVGDKSKVRSYISKTNFVRYLDKTFDDTLAEEAKYDIPEYGMIDYKDGNPDAAYTRPGQVSEEVIAFWGPGYEPEFYDDLERRYKDWTGGVEITDPSERGLYKQVCLLEAIINKDTAAGKAIDKNVNALNNLLGSMNLRPAQKKDEATDAELDKMPLGVGIKTWEQQRPLPATEPSKRDVHHYIKFFTTWVLGHACKMVGLKNSYNKLYEDEMARLRVERPEYSEEDDDAMLADIFGSRLSDD